MSLQPDPNNVRRAAERFAEHWINGSCRYVLDELANEPHSVACMLCAIIAVELRTHSRGTAERFIEALAKELKLEDS